MAFIVLAVVPPPVATTTPAILPVPAVVPVGVYDPAVAVLVTSQPYEGAVVIMFTNCLVVVVKTRLSYMAVIPAAPYLSVAKHSIGAVAEKVGKLAVSVALIAVSVGALPGVVIHKCWKLPLVVVAIARSVDLAAITCLRPLEYTVHPVHRIEELLFAFTEPT